MPTKLFLIEGIPGSGKTTTAQFVAQWLQQRNQTTSLFLEGNLDHPADFESVARLDAGEYAALQDAFPAQAGLLASHVRIDDGDYFFRYRHLQQTQPTLTSDLIHALSRYEIYELPVSTWRRLILRRWQQFATAAQDGDTAYVFECCFLQNPLTMLLGRNDEPPAQAKAFILDLAAAVEVLEPVLVYLHPGDVRQTLLHVAQTRPPEWLEFVINYHTQQGHGRAQNWQGFDGLVNFYEMRQALELEMLSRLPFPTLLVEHSNWASNQTRIADFLAATSGPAQCLW